MDRSKYNFNKYLLTLAVVWAVFSIIPLINLSQGIIKNLGADSFAIKMGISTLMGPFFAVYENIVEPNTPFPLNSGFGISFGLILIALMCFPKFKNNVTSRNIGIFAMTIWCLTGCGEAIRFVT